MKQHQNLVSGSASLLSMLFNPEHGPWHGVRPHLVSPPQSKAEAVCMLSSTEDRSQDTVCSQSHHGGREGLAAGAQGQQSHMASFIHQPWGQDPKQVSWLLSL